LAQYENLSQQAGFHAHSVAEVESWFDEPLPLQPTGIEEVLEMVKSRVLDVATGNMGPNMYAYVMAGGNQVSSIADFLASTINQNPTKWHLGASMTEIEKRVIKWTAQILGYTPDAGGVMVSGGSAANLTGLTVARNVFFLSSKLINVVYLGCDPRSFIVPRRRIIALIRALLCLALGVINCVASRQEPTLA